MSETREMKEWTIMFFFASDNPLASTLISQLKAIKNAGYHKDANVLVYFDPHIEETPSHIFEVNLYEKAKNPKQPTNIGFKSKDPFIRDLMRDKLWQDNQLDRDNRPIKERIKELLGENASRYNPPDPSPFFKQDYEICRGDETRGEETPDVEISPCKALQGFLKLCRKRYKARRYMLFIIGHGLVVSNDIFLYDEHAEESTLKLKTLAKILTEFKGKIAKDDAELELVSMHSCSMSSAEVGYEMKDATKYLLASQGPAFVGSWPYRHILIRIFNDLEKFGGGMSADQLKEMYVKIFKYCLYNNTDFVMAGYSFDLSLCRLGKIKSLTKPLKNLSERLRKGLTRKRLKEQIILAHWESQSFWKEGYTDIYDFCFCLYKNCVNLTKNSEGSNGNDEERLSVEVAGELKKLCAAADEVMKVLVSESDGGKKGLIVASKFAGPTYQYSHGLSVFFPWSLPTDKISWKEYEEYKFKETKWQEFLEDYFEKTKRERRKNEIDSRIKPPNESNEERLFEDMASLLYDPEGYLSLEKSFTEITPLHDKSGPNDPLGDACQCPTIKNHPRATRKRNEKWLRADPFELPFSNDFFYNDDF